MTVLQRKSCVCVFVDYDGQLMLLQIKVLSKFPPRTQCHVIRKSVEVGYAAPSNFKEGTEECVVVHTKVPLRQHMKFMGKLLWDIFILCEDVFAVIWCNKKLIRQQLGRRYRQNFQGKKRGGRTQVLRHKEETGDARWKRG